MKKGLKIFLGIFLILAILVGALVFAYLNNSFPVLNSIVDSFLFPEKTQEIPEPVVVEEVYIAPKEKLPELLSLNSFNILPSNQIKKSYVSKDIEDYELPNISLSSNESNNKISCSGDYTWELNIDFPVISGFTVYGDCIGFVTANYYFILVDIKTGSKIKDLYLGISCKAVDGNLDTMYGFYPMFEFSTENDEKYSVIFGSSNKYFTLQNIEKNHISPKDYFSPSVSAKDFMLSRMKSWGLEDISDIPPLNFYLEDGEYLFEDSTVQLFLYNPKDSGKYQIGLMNKNGAFISDNAVVAVFKEDGTLVEVSLGYVATEPNVTVYLEDELYYIIAYRVFVDESSLKEVYLGSKKAL